MNNFYVPNDVIVGIKDDAVAFTKRLGFLSFVEGKKVRKQVSLDGWRDHKYPMMTIHNKPRSGFILNRHIDHKAYDFGNDRVRFRVYCPEDGGFEFEITPQNLSYILSVCDINKREITEPCVFAWDKGELMLIPVNSQHYIDAVETTHVRNNFKSLQKSSSISGEWKMGTVIKNKSGNHMIYVGKKKFTYYKSVLSSLKALKDVNLEMVNGKLMFVYEPKEIHIGIPVKEFHKARDGMTFIQESFFSWEQINPENYIEYEEMSFDDLKTSFSLEGIKNVFESDTDKDVESEIFSFLVKNISSENKWYFDVFSDFTNSYVGKKESVSLEALSKNKIDLRFLMKEPESSSFTLDVVNIKGAKLKEGGFCVDVYINKESKGSFSGNDIEEFWKKFPMFKNGDFSFILRSGYTKLVAISLN